MRLIINLLSFIPRRLPSGAADYNALAARIANLCSDVTLELNDIKFTISAVIMHLGPQAHMLSDRYFVKCIRAGAAKQIAAATFRDVKLAQQKAQEEAAKLEAEAKQLEATASQEITQIVAKEEAFKS